MLRVKDLQNELTETRVQIRSLMSENRLLKMMEKRQENALSKYEGTHAKLPQIIKSYSEDIRSLQTRLRYMKSSYRELENKNRLLSTELLDIQKKHKHLLDLTKNKQLGEREKLSNQLEEAENTIKQQETTNQNLIKKIELLSKNHRNQINVEISKTKVLQLELNHLKETNDKLVSKIEKLKYQSYGGRRSYVFGQNQSIAPQSRSTAMSKNSLLVDVIGVVVDRVPSSKISVKTAKPELVHGESEISDHTKDLQKNLMRQIHEDVINKPNMLVNDKMESSNSFGVSSDLNFGIAELMKKKDLSDDCDESIMQQIEPNMAVNPFSLSNIHEMNSSGEHKSVTKLRDNDEDFMNAREVYSQKESSYLDADDTSSTSSVILMNR